jgi:hypothetical protein
MRCCSPAGRAAAGLAPGRTLAAASSDGTVHLWDTSPAAAKAESCVAAVAARAVTTPAAVLAERRRLILTGDI